MRLAQGALLVACACAASASSRADELDRQIRAAMSRDGTPGLTLAIVRHGAIVRLGAYGYGDLEWKAPATPATRFEIASVSKMLVGAAVRILVDEGKLGLDDPVGKYFAPLPDSWKPMRVRHLLTMSSGLPEDWGGPLLPYDADVTAPSDEAAMVKAFTTLKLQAPVGTEFHYSGPGYAMLGYIVAKVSGMPLARFVDERLLAPAGMSETSYLDNAAVVPERARGYRKQGGKILRGRYVGQFLHARPDTGILSTARDLARWVIALEQNKIVKDARPLWRGATADGGRALDYAYGWRVDTLFGHARQLHDGGYRTGFRSVVERFADDDLSVVVLTNCDWTDPGAYAYLAARTYLGDLPDPEPTAALVDPAPARTATLIAAVKALATRKIDEAVMTADALEPLPLAEAADFVAHAKSFRYAGGGSLAARALTMHGHRLVGYELLRAELGDEAVYLALYRDDRGKIAYVAPAR